MAAVTGSDLWPIQDTASFRLVVVYNGPYLRGDVTNTNLARYLTPTVTTTPAAPIQTRFPVAP